MTHQILGGSLNLSRESISREMEKLTRKGLVHYNSKRQIVLTDMTALSEQRACPSTKACRNGRYIHLSNWQRA